MTIIPERLDILDRITLKYGAHQAPEPGNEADAAMCAMEAAAYIAGEPWSDQPQCVCPVIASFLRSWNDGIGEDATRTRLLLPLVALSIGTRSSDDVQDRRAFMAADWAVRTFTPAWLRLAGLTGHADALAGLPELTTIEAFDAARTEPIAVAWAAAVARAAAGDVAWAAAWAAVEAAVAAYNAALAEASEFAQEVSGRIGDDIDEKSEKWQESEKGEAAGAWREPCPRRR